MDQPDDGRAVRPAERDEYAAAQPRGTRIGIALSGGGIRSAAFNLGALQALQEDGVLSAARYLAAVSGGNYVATAMTISQVYRDPAEEAVAGGTGKEPWAHGSVEERRLRMHTDYMAPGWPGRVWFGLSVVLGFVLNYLPFLCWSFLIGRVGGWLLHWRAVRLDDLRLAGLAMPASSTIRVLLALFAGCLLAAFVFVFCRRLRDGHRRPRDYGQSWAERLAPAFVLAAVGTAVLVVVPALAAQYVEASRWVLVHVLGMDASAFDSSTRGRVVVAGVWLLLVLAAAAAAMVLGRWLRARRLMLALSSVAVAGMLLVPLLSSLEYSARRGLESGGDVVGAAGALGIVLVMAVAVPNLSSSLHLFYRERLSSVFALQRHVEGSRVTARPIPYDRTYDKELHLASIGRRLAERGVRFPELVVCCAVNLTSDEVPYGRFAESFTFTPRKSGSPLFGYQDTADLECPCGHGPQLTLPSLMAVSGAAVSPLMGRFTYPPMRFLMALTNVRLGVWIPNPCVQNACRCRPAPPGWRTWWAHVVRGWYQPGALHVLREALGALRSDHRQIYLSDGGHWENLGLVELIRRRCSHILCFDASSDRTGDGFDVGRAISLARADLGAEVDLDPRPVMGGVDGPAEDIAVRGTVRYPDGDQQARLVYAKATLTPGASWSLRAFQARERRFPHHPTSKQMFTDEQFEAYRSLGHQAGKRAVELLNLIRPALDTAGADDDEPARATVTAIAG